MTARNNNPSVTGEWQATRQAMAEEKVPPCRKRFAFFVGTDESLNLSLPDPPDSPLLIWGERGERVLFRHV